MTLPYAPSKLHVFFKKYLGYGLFALFCLFVARNVTKFTLQSAAFVVLTIFAALLLSIPREKALKIFFLYISIEGALKLMSDYEPVVHVGADMLVVIMLLAWCTSSIMTGQRHIPRVPYFGLITALTIWVGLEVFNPFGRIIPALASFKIYLTMIPLFFFAYLLIDSKEQIEGFYNLFVFVGFLIAGLAIVEKIAGQDFVTKLSRTYMAKVEQFSFTGRLYRPFSTTNNPGGASVFGVATMPFIFYFIFKAKKYYFRKITLWAVVLVTFIMLYVSFVRINFLACLIEIALMTFLLRRRIPKKIIHLVLVFIIVGGAFFIADKYITGGMTQLRFGSLTRGETLTRSRIGGWRAIKFFMMEYPLGAGLSRHGSAGTLFRGQLETLHIPQPDNYYAMLLSDLGIPGAIIMLAIIFSLIYRGIKSLKLLRDTELAYAAAAIIALFITLMIQSWGAMPLTGNPYTAYFWFLAGVLIKIPLIDRKNAGNHELLQPQKYAQETNYYKPHHLSPY